MNNPNENEIKLRDRLIREISERNHCDVECNRSFQTMWIHNADYSTEFRYVILMDKLIVSRVCFNNRRKGCMTACLDILKEFSNILGYNQIEIQSVETFEMMKWCNKMEFIPRDYNLHIIDDINKRTLLIGDYDLNL